MYSVLPRRGQSAADTTRALNERTREATADVLTKWSGKTVVMVWEHHHIADEALEASFPDQKVTLRQLMNLDAVEPRARCRRPGQARPPTISGSSITTPDRPAPPASR
jgi:hypothetical protein